MARGRKSALRYWASRQGGGYFTTQQGKQILLAQGPKDDPDGPTYQRAEEAYRKLQGEAGKHVTNLGHIAAKYAAHLKSNKERLRQFHTHIDSFIASYGDLYLTAILPHHVTTWLQSRTTWGDTTKHHAFNYLTMMVNWYVKEHKLPPNHLQGNCDIPEARIRGKEARMSEELMDLIHQSPKCPCVKLVLEVLRATGARPIEIFKAKIKNLRGNCIVHPWNPPTGEYRWKNARTTKKDRVICLPPEIVEKLRTLAENREVYEPLVPTPRNCHWTQSNFAYHWTNIRLEPLVDGYMVENDILPTNVIPYGYRHTFATNWIEDGRSIHVLAKLLGTSVKMIEDVYGHPEDVKIHEMYMDFYKK
jgi:integrase